MGAQYALSPAGNMLRTHLSSPIISILHLFVCLFVCLCVCTNQVYNNYIAAITAALSTGVATMSRL